MSENDQNKTPSTTSKPEKKATSGRTGRRLIPGTLVPITGKETEEEMDQLAQEIYERVMKHRQQQP
jgi:hypothetical protein